MSDTSSGSTNTEAGVFSDPEGGRVGAGDRRTSDGPTILATGPLTSDPLAEAIREITGADALHFYDAISPIVLADTVREDVVFRASRYGHGDDYLNCPMTEDEFDRFYDALTAADCAPLHDFEERLFRASDGSARNDVENARHAAPWAGIVPRARGGGPVL